MGSAHTCPQGSYINRIDLNTKKLSDGVPVIVGYKFTCSDARPTKFSGGLSSTFTPYTENVISPYGFVLAETSINANSDDITSLLMSAPSGPLARIGPYKSIDTPVRYPSAQGLITGVVFTNNKITQWNRDPSLGPEVRQLVPIDEPVPAAGVIRIDSAPSYTPPVSTVPTGTSTVVVSTPSLSQPVAALPIYSMPPTADAVPVYNVPPTVPTATTTVQSSGGGIPVVIPSMPMDIAQPASSVDTSSPVMSQVESGTLPVANSQVTQPTQPTQPAYPTNPTYPTQQTTSQSPITVVPVPQPDAPSDNLFESFNLTWLLFLIVAVALAVALTYYSAGATHKGGAGHMINYVK